MRAGRRHAVLAALLLCTLAPLHAAPLSVAAASSLRPWLDAVLAMHRADTGAAVQVAYGSTGKQVAQIRHGAPFVLFVAADVESPQRLVDDGLAAGPVTPVARGRLVTWVRDGAAPGLAALADPRWRTVAVANPLHAPYGRGAIEALRHGGVHDRVQHRLVYGENVGQAAQMVVSGAADVGIIGWSLARSAGGAYALIADTLHAPLLHGAVLTTRGADDSRAQALLRRLHSDAARALLPEHGFSAP